MIEEQSIYSWYLIIMVKKTKQTKFGCDIQTAAFFFIYKTVTVTNAVKAFVLL